VEPLPLKDPTPNFSQTERRFKVNKSDWLKNCRKSARGYTIEELAEELESLDQEVRERRALD